MGKPTGFLEYQRIQERKRPVHERVKDYKEVSLEIPLEDLKEQGARCMDCGIPFCHSFGCPLGNLIPEWNDAVYSGQWQEAYYRLEQTNNFPEITGRICPAPCEASCTLSINDAPVAIKQLERSIAEKAFDRGWVMPQHPKKETGNKIAVIGSGPAGLSAAQQLRRAGHSVTVFERSDKAGGILRYGIPDFKLEKRIIDRRIHQIKAEGVIFETGVDIGKDISASYMKKKFDVILLAGGAGKARGLAVPGDGYEGIHFAMEYLTRSNKFTAGEISRDEIINARGKKVLVIGGGDTGSDCVGTARRQGAEKIYQFEILPKPREWKEAHNPDWPFWPGILRTSTSHEEGCERDWGIETVRFSGRGVKIEKAYFQRIIWKQYEGKYRKEIAENKDFSLDIDLVFIAAGFVHTEHSDLHRDLGIEYDQRGNISVDDRYSTNVEGVFAAGDTHTGASLVVRAVSHGREAALAVNEYLCS